MKNDFSSSWKSSTKPNKQRKYRFNAPLHIKAHFLNVHLSKELREKYHTRAVRARVGDKVRIMSGQFKKQEGKVEEVDTNKTKVFISKIEHIKKDGTKARYPIHPSNLMIVELNTDDKRRFGKEKKTKEKKAKIAVAPKTEKILKSNSEHVKAKIAPKKSIKSQ